MGCNCKATKTISTINELYGDNNVKKRDNLSTILLKVLFSIVLIPVYVIIFVIVCFKAVLGKGTIDISRLLNFRNVWIKQII